MKFKIKLSVIVKFDICVYLLNIDIIKKSYVNWLNILM